MDGMKHPLEGTAGTASAGGASDSELQQGFVPCRETCDDMGNELPDEDDMPGFVTSQLEPEEEKGFLDRPQGWER